VYVPAHFAVDDLDEIAGFVARAGAAELVTFDGIRPVATLLPVLWDWPDGGGASGAKGESGRGAGGTGSRYGRYGRLVGHVALANPQWDSALPDVPALAIVHGPQAYISPSWYQSTTQHGRTVPTWNYTSVHLTGPVTFHRDEGWLREAVTRLTERYESGRDGRWWVSDAPEKYIAGQLRAIVGVEMRVEQVEAKDKLSQNQNLADRAGVIAALRTEPDAGSHAIADLMAAREAAAEG